MNIEELREFCISKKGVTESLPFGSETLVFKVMDKVFLLTGMENNPLEFNVKCDPEKASKLRERYSCVKPGFHMNKKHWNTIIADDSVSIKSLHEWITDSYNLVILGLSKKDQQKLLDMK